MKQATELAKKTPAGKVGTRIYGIPKLDDANDAGGKNSKVRGLNIILLGRGGGCENLFLRLEGFEFFGCEEVGLYRFFLFEFLCPGFGEKRG